MLLAISIYYYKIPKLKIYKDYIKVDIYMLHTEILTDLDLQRLIKVKSEK